MVCRIPERIDSRDTRGLTTTASFFTSFFFLTRKASKKGWRKGVKIGMLTKRRTC